MRQAVVVDADLTVAAMPADDRAPPVDYADVVARIRHLAAESDFGLIENFADAIAREVALPPVLRARVRCCKPRIFADVESVGVEVTREVASDDRERQPPPNLV